MKTVRTGVFAMAMLYIIAGGLFAQTLPSQEIPGGADAYIRIDTYRVIGEVDKNVFGNFAEHLGRVIYGGIYDEGSPLADENGYRMDVMKAAQELGVTVLRYPGGNFVSGYNWKDGIGPKDQRPAGLDYAWGGLETNRFGTDEFLTYCEVAGFEPYICINAGLGTVEEARQWVEYVNGDRASYWAELRRSNGREEPYNVQFWGLGNELDGYWQLGYKNPADYAKFALEAGKAMRWVDPSIKLIASGSSNFREGSDWKLWNHTVLESLHEIIDYISLHLYIGNPTDEFERFLGASSQDLDNYIEILQGEIRASQDGIENPRPIYIAFDEWNVWYRVRGADRGARGLEEQYNYEDALAMGMFLNGFFRHAEIIKMANLAQLVNGIAPIFTNEEGLFLQPIYFPIAEYAKQKENLSLDSQVLSPTFTIDERPPIQCLNVSTTYDPDEGAVYLNVLNMSETDDIETRIDNVNGPIGSRARVWEMNHDDLKTTHTFGDDRKVRPTTRTASLNVANDGFTYTFPKHSLTILRLEME